MRIATWNVNSIRSRIDRVEAWVQRADVDVLAIQETKCREDQFPHDRFAALGYEVAHHGLNQWNGVAIASRVGLEDVSRGFPDLPQWGEPAVEEARAIGATCAGIRLWSLYVPNGRHITDPHMQYKLAWLDTLRVQTQAWAETGSPFALMGDWNIAPQDEDVWSMEYYLDKSHVSPPERAAFQAVLDAGVTDVVRPHTEPGDFTYWDYQRLAFPKRRGMRIDFILASEPLAERVQGAVIDREERKGQGASDHAPVVIEVADA
ncbi:exodeoxyribonuclease III [Knoellia flava TL1]|uniref:Exodeoxyribonuclease III n=2 Tax=Knoellia flava TaxID=913969 RepID=A0ABR4XI70_9MICO|nr:exodeoxyribonuclease III [Knoellia flava]KGN35903.1 exodeoxyribonuclease III [Knoellia flava TL1]GGB79690.1 putative exodeoxyribonuclease III protein XthA [Knoellia flava]